MHILGTHGGHDAVGVACTAVKGGNCIGVGAWDGHGVEWHRIILRLPQRGLIIVPISRLPGMGLKQVSPYRVSETLRDRALEAFRPGVRPNCEGHSATLDTAMHCHSVNDH